MYFRYTIYVGKYILATLYKPHTPHMDIGQQQHDGKWPIHRLYGTQPAKREKGIHVRKWTKRSKVWSTGPHIARQKPGKGTHHSRMKLAHTDKKNSVFILYFEGSEGRTARVFIVHCFIRRLVWAFPPHAEYANDDFHFALWGPRPRHAKFVSYADDVGTNSFLILRLKRKTPSPQIHSRQL